MNGPSQQAYDRGTTIFSPDGRLYQVDYAREAVERGAPSVAVRTDEGVALAAHRRRRSPLVDRDSVEKLRAVDDRVAVGTAGHAADGRRLVDVARRAAQHERLRYDQRATVETLATELADHVQEQTQRGGTRPYGVALLLAGVDPDGTPQLYEVDPSGTAQGWRAAAVGDGRDDAVDHFEAEHDPERSLDDALDLALAGLSAATDDAASDTVSAMTVDADGHAPVDPERLEAVLEDEPTGDSE